MPGSYTKHLKTFSSGTTMKKFAYAVLGVALLAPSLGAFADFRFQIPLRGLVVQTGSSAGGSELPGQFPDANMEEPAPSGLSFSATELSFGAISVWQSKTLSFSVSNTGQDPRALPFAAAAPRGFKYAHNCPAELMPGADCSISVQFYPKYVGVFDVNWQVG